MSTMSWIADYVQDITDSDDEYESICFELSKHYDGKLDLDKLSKKAFATVITWEEENRDVPDVQEWDNLITRSER